MESTRPRAAEDSDIRLHTAIMTHPYRASWAREISRELGGAQLVSDPEPWSETGSALRTALTAWASAPKTCTHQLLLQDDVMLSSSFLDRARRGAEIFPDAVLAHFANWEAPNGAAVRLGALAGATWVEAVREEYFPCLAVVMPRRYAEGFVDYAAELVSLHREDDVVFEAYIDRFDLPTFISVPTLVEHRVLPSIIGNGSNLYSSPCHLPDLQWDNAVEESVAHSIKILPVFFNGQAICYVRVDVPGGPALVRLSLERSAKYLGLDVEDLRSEFDRLWKDSPECQVFCDAVHTEFCFRMWTTAFFLGWIVGSGRVPVRQLSPGVPPRRTDIATAALRTLPQSGQRGTLLPHRLVEDNAEAGFAVVLAGYELGHSRGRSSAPAHAGDGAVR